MHGDLPELRQLYAGEGALELLRTAALVEARGYGHWTRLREVVEISRLMGLR